MLLKQAIGTNVYRTNSLFFSGGQNGCLDGWFGRCIDYFEKYDPYGACVKMAVQLLEGTHDVELARMWLA